MKESKWAFAWYFYWFAAVILSTFYNYFLLKKMPAGWFMSSLDSGQAVLLHAGVLLNIAAFMARGELVAKVLEGLQELDDRLAKIGVKLRYGGGFILKVLLSRCLIFGVLGLNQALRSKPYAFIYSHLVTSAMEATFVCLVRFLRYRISRITGALRRLPVECRSTYLLLLSSCHSSLLDFAETLGRVFSLPILYFSLTVFLTTTVNFYSLIVKVMAAMTLLSFETLDDCADKLFRIGLRLSQLLAVTSSSVSFSKQVLTYISLKYNIIRNFYFMEYELCRLSYRTRFMP